MTPFALAAVAAALQRFSALFVANHAAHSQTDYCEQYRQRNRCSHIESPFQVMKTLRIEANAPIRRVYLFLFTVYNDSCYLASIFPPPLNMSVELSLYGLTSR